LSRLVGPVLAGESARRIAAVLAETNPGTRVIDRGSYLRVQREDSLVLERAAAERAVGGPFKLPEDLEAIMPAFAGRLDLSGERARWEVGE
jgi:toluene monooxygenase system protein D